MFDIKVALFQKLLLLSYISGFSMGNGNGKFCWGGFTKLLMGCAPSHMAPINLAVNEGIICEQFLIFITFHLAE